MKTALLVILLATVGNGIIAVSHMSNGAKFGYVAVVTILSAVAGSLAHAASKRTVVKKG
jgi:hypothetical protein